MKRLLLLRHAQSLGTQPGGSDKTRELSPNGIADAQKLGALLNEKKLTPDAILCSTATRTQATLAHVTNALPTINTDYLESLYNAPPENILNAIHEANNNAETLLVVAHNPGIHALAAKLAMDDGSAIYDRLIMGYAPATLAVLQCDIQNWHDLKLGINSLEALFESIEYNSSERPTRWM